VTWALVGDLFGRKHFATIRGWIGMIQSLASMPAAVFTGWIYDQTQSYTYALLPFIALYGLAGLFLWGLPRQTRPEAGSMRPATVQTGASLAGS